MMPRILLKPSSEVAVLAIAPLLSEQTGRVEAWVSNVRLKSMTTVQVIKQCSFLFDDLIA